MAMAFAALASASEDRRFLDMRNSLPKSEPDWKRKKCKSCERCGAVCNGKWSKPANQACESYRKRK